MRLGGIGGIFEGRVKCKIVRSRLGAMDVLRRNKPDVSLHLSAYAPTHWYVPTWLAQDPATTTQHARQDDSM